MLALDKVDPQFRILADKVFFTDRTDLDVSEFKKLFENREAHYGYLWDRFTRSTEIFWDEEFWINRLDLLLSLQSKRLELEVGQFLFFRFKKLAELQMNPTPRLHNEFVHYIAWTKVRAARKEDIVSIREFFANLVHTMSVGKISNIIQHFIPHLFENMNEYLEFLGQKVSQSARNIEVLLQCEKQGIPIDRGPILKLSKTLLLKRALNRPNRRSLFALLDDSIIMNELKKEYKAEHRSRLIALIKSCDYKEIDELHLRNIKNLLELDSSIADELLSTYADKLYARGIGYKGSNVKRLIRVCRTFPIFSPKKVLVYLSTQNKMADIKHLLLAFPELKTLAPFV
jgi:hypothetical protein